MFNGEINIIYDIKRDDEYITIFGRNFVENNKNNSTVNKKLYIYFISIELSLILLLLLFEYNDFLLIIKGIKLKNCPIYVRV